ncbi:hypothetical protein AXG93_3893s1400 [Marchantia polymorpha subsp. ruderalis]|uniref:Uncharacterized protein n=1 Tax=Marchantia polymorpha subsp. ruderalis TaxID=1480154 RepID=A0A176WA91_MARPO|nr:hypothetical protein AXG93_3893s1400 [Marchantia polymorpha subsp. ruderalis]
MLQGQKKKDLRSPEWRPLTVPEEDASKEAEEKETDTDMKTPRWNRGPSAKTIVYTQSRSAAKEQLGKVEAKLLEVEERIRQLAEQTNEALTEKMNLCLRDFVI